MSVANVNRDRHQQNVALVLGGALDPERRRAAEQSEKPRVDVMEMERKFHARLYDYEWLVRQADQGGLPRFLTRLARRYGFWSEFLALGSFWAVRNVDIIYTTGEDVGLILAILLRLFRIRGPRLVVRMEQPMFGHTPFLRSVFSRMLRSALPRIEVILCRTEAHVRYLEQNFSPKDTQVYFVPETTDTSFFNRLVPAVDLPSLSFLNKPYIVSAGLEMRDYDTLISAVRGLPVTALICAGSPWAKVSYSTDGVDLPENVIVRSFSPLEMREIYRSAALVVLPIKPTERACGMNVVLEAWAMGRAVVASKTEGLVSYIEDQNTGVFVTPSDPEALRKLISSLIANPTEAERLGQNGYRKVTKELCMENYLDVVNTTLSSTMQVAG